MAHRQRQLCGIIPTIFYRTLRQQFLMPSKDSIAVTYVIRQFRTCAKAVERIQAKIIAPFALVSRGRHTKSRLRSQLPLVNQDLSLELCEAVAVLLNKASVENLLWGTSLQNAYTVPTVVSELSFIVAGNQLQKAVTALESDSFLLCRNKSCFMNAPRDCQGLSFDNPHAHFHLVAIPGVDEYKLSATVKLYTMEDKLWELPIFGKGVNFTDGPSNNVISANDTSLLVGTTFQGVGRFPNSVSGIRIPTLHRYVEALILLALRHPNTFSTSAWVSELSYVSDLVDIDQLGHLALKQFCVWVHKGGCDFKTMVKQAREVLGSRIPEDTHWDDVQEIRATWG